MKEYKYDEIRLLLSKILTLDERGIRKDVAIKNRSKTKSHIDFMSSYAVSLRVILLNRKLHRIFFFGPNCSNTLYDKSFRKKKKKKLSDFKKS